MSDLSEGYKLLISKKRPSHKLLVPLLRWTSANERDIELCQRINRRFFLGNHKVFISELSLSNTLKHFLPYPRKTSLVDEKDFFLDDVCKYYGWSRLELNKNLDVIDLSLLKPVIAKLFGYDKKERRQIGA